MSKITVEKSSNKTIVLGGGCFWCLEAVYNQIKGIIIVSGYAGGTTKNPSYEDVVTGRTGHAEVVIITYNPEVIALREILQIFFQMHDPTTLNRQGNNIGTQYCSIILYSTPEDKKTIQAAISYAQKNWKESIVTEVRKLEEFYKAEEYHQQYYEKNPNQGYCRVIIKPKIDKLKRVVLP
ncbi:MAG: peptide-methionine (S)-S-oxide reductase MsrA [Candidatus Heimdallarchaeota archaeon]|nr:MAG: peptide-methionine (S)-S-oxide reductase MsrA [Candidatus Heimdallarchaeota archaeon]